MKEQSGESAAVTERGPRRWARWPWERCVAVTPDVGRGRCRCDLVRDHPGDHLAERGMYDVLWPANTWTSTDRYLTPRGA